MWIFCRKRKEGTALGCAKYRARDTKHVLLILTGAARYRQYSVSARYSVRTSKHCASLVCDTERASERDIKSSIKAALQAFSVVLLSSHYGDTGIFCSSVAIGPLWLLRGELAASSTYAPTRLY
ncbi:hypothetical protein NDU88_000549 [Pleurodeles waltl]|uniref:Uncharacterized protein n=1 Tax=Pleurodeles waltl TaxID=8319 RepID=A0AAV7V5D4_PLEWA|nr:hypothetical protein NDU88_000549 [Pleurodeles waltl]